MFSIQQNVDDNLVIYCIMNKTPESMIPGFIYLRIQLFINRYRNVTICARVQI